MNRRALLLAFAGVTAWSMRAASSERDPLELETTRRLGRSLRPGDLVFRQGRSLESAAVLASAPFSRFSHVGMAVQASADLRIIHSLPASDGERGGVLSSTWEAFAFAPDVALVAAYRLGQLDPAAVSRMTEALRAMLGRPFNAGFTSNPADGLYCTQVVLQALASASPNLAASVRPTPVNLLREPVYLPDALLALPGLAEVRP